MSIQAIGAIDKSSAMTNQKNTTDVTAKGSLDQMMANQTVATEGSLPLTEMGVHVEDAFSWLSDNESMMQNDPQRLKAQLMDYIKHFKNPDGSNLYNSLDKINTFVASLSNYFRDNQKTEMVDFLYNIRTQLIGTGFFMQEFIQKAMFPTVQNGGKFLDWDEA